MKNIKLVIIALLSINLGFAQLKQDYKIDLKVIEVSNNVNVHFRSPEPVQFVDLSTSNLIGDLPIENVVRLKIQDGFDVTDSITGRIKAPLPFMDNEEIGVVTIVGQSYMAQYKIIYRNNIQSTNIITNIEISPEQMQPLEFPSYDMSPLELKNVCMDIIKKKPQRKPKRKSYKLKIKAVLNNIYTVGDYVFIDLGFFNKTNLSYSVDEIKFTIDDKKILKSTNVQSNTIKPAYRLYNHKSFKRQYRNIYVFKKFTYPDNKVLTVRLTEEQVSGRTIELGIKYKDVLQADTL